MDFILQQYISNADFLVIINILMSYNQAHVMFEYGLGCRSSN